LLFFTGNYQRQTAETRRNASRARSGDRKNSEKTAAAGERTEKISKCPPAITTGGNIVLAQPQI
jgi:hypothetical protein